jgi:hypothetical protein
VLFHAYTLVIILTTGQHYEGPKNNRNLNVARELEVVARCAPRCRESTQYYSSWRQTARVFCCLATPSSRATFKFRLFLGPPRMDWSLSHKVYMFVLYGYSNKKLRLHITSIIE